MIPSSIWATLVTEGQSVDALAERLGVTLRHLRRLFVRHWGAPPTGVAKTICVQRAKRLLSETDLPVIRLRWRPAAEVSGVSMRFFAEVYKCPPSEIRRPITRGTADVSRR
jgi:AraC family transcriptional regulator of adaptative response/methylated-DNA-[protein]-cysteine methyltransferase